MTPLQKKLNKLEHEINWIMTILNVWHDRLPRPLAVVEKRLIVMRKIIRQLYGVGQPRVGRPSLGPLKARDIHRAT